jgi:hypothetical protein
MGKLVTVKPSGQRTIRDKAAYRKRCGTYHHAHSIVAQQVLAAIEYEHPRNAVQRRLF